MDREPLLRGRHKHVATGGKNEAMKHRMWVISRDPCLVCGERCADTVRMHGVLGCSPLKCYGRDKMVRIASAVADVRRS